MGDTVKTYIKRLFSVDDIYSLEDIKTYINDILGGVTIDKLYIYYAIDEFINKKIVLYDRYERPGYLLYVPNDSKETYYIFQPNELDEPSATTNIRDKPLSFKDETVVMKSVDVPTKIDIKPSKKTKSTTETVVTTELFSEELSKLTENVN